MKNLYKKLGLMTIIFSLSFMAACSNSESEPEKVVEKEPVTEENFKSTEDLKAEFKANAKEVSFVDVSGDKYEDQSYFKLTGEVGPVGKDTTGALQEFLLNTIEGEGHGAYLIQSVPSNIDSEMEVAEGDQITVYGQYQGKDENTSMPVVFIQVIEK